MSCVFLSSTSKRQNYLHWLSPREVGQWKLEATSKVWMPCRLNLWDTAGFCPKHFPFFLNFGYGEKPENAQPYQHLKLTNHHERNKIPQMPNCNRPCGQERDFRGEGRAKKVMTNPVWTSANTPRPQKISPSHNAGGNEGVVGLYPHRTIFFVRPRISKRKTTKQHTKKKKTKQNTPTHNCIFPETVQE